MSELRDLAAALGTISASLVSIEAHTAQAVANGEQLREGMHDLRNKLQAVLTERDGTERAIAQIQTWMADFSRQLGTLTSQQTVQQNGLLEGLRTVRHRLDELEGKDEATQP
jgi:hypothetical protein